MTCFKDGQDFPDLLATLYAYPGTTVDMHCNQNNAAGKDTIFYGKEATLAGNTLTVAPQDTKPQPEGSLNGWTAEANGDHVVEDGVFGNNAARATHMANHSYFQKSAAPWDAATQTIKG